MEEHLGEVFTLLERIRKGGDVSFDEVQKVPWQVDDKLEPLVQRIYRSLQMFASDEDIRRADSQYDASWRRGMDALYHQLMERR